MNEYGSRKQIPNTTTSAMQVALSTKLSSLNIGPHHPEVLAIQLIRGEHLILSLAECVLCNVLFEYFSHPI